MLERKNRLAVLRQIIIDLQPTGQDELKLALANKGFFISQPQLSRDLARIHAYKQDGHYIVVDDLRFKLIP